MKNENVQSRMKEDDNPFVLQIVNL